MTHIPSQCLLRGCRHLRKPIQDPKHPDTDDRVIDVCAAFPDGDGIPDDIASGENLHLEPVDGDHGIQFEKDENFVEFPPPSRGYLPKNARQRKLQELARRNAKKTPGNKQSFDPILGIEVPQSVDQHKE
jgi:hypothetical protein